MRLNTGLLYGNENSTCEIKEFKAQLRLKNINFQDTPHKAAKFRKSILLEKLIPLGREVIHINHLRDLMNKTSRSEYNLRQTNVFKIDIMNFDAALNICSPNIIQSLQENVGDNEGTQQYLRLMYMTIHAILEENLEIEKRLYYLWYTVFFLRIWRSWILNHDVYTLTNNFMFLNNYISIEINAHGLYNLILHHIDRGTMEDFYPWMCGSQPAESFYRILRSLSPMLSTMVNCTVLEAMYKIYKIEKQCKIMNKIYDKDLINFPRKAQFRASFESLDRKSFSNSELPNTPQNLPKIGDSFKSEKEKSNDEKALKKILSKAKKDAYSDIGKFGIKRENSRKDNANYIHVNINSTLLIDQQLKKADYEEDSIDDINEDTNSKNDEGTSSNESEFENDENPTNYESDNLNDTI